MDYSEILKDKKYDPISSKEELELARRIQHNNDHKAVERLVCANLRFVVLVAIRYSKSGISLEDLIQEGNLGVMEAAKRFDEEKNCKFISYAVWWIRHHILNLIHRTSRVVRVPPAAAYVGTKISETIEKLEQRYGREPTNAEIAIELNTSERMIETILSTNESVSLNKPVLAKNCEMMDFLEASEEEDTTVYDYIVNKISKLRSVEREIIETYFLSNYTPTLDEIGDNKKISRERVRQIKAQALNNLRRKIIREEVFA